MLRHAHKIVIPAQAGTQELESPLDLKQVESDGSGFCGVGGLQSGFDVGRGRCRGSGGGGLEGLGFRVWGLGVCVV